MKALPVIEVEWEDSGGIGKWHSIKDAEQMVPLNIKSVGYLLKESKHCIVIIQSKDDQDPKQCDSSLAVPRACVKSIRKLE